ncbi:MAG: hypothetical protein JW762_06050 [Dehalococcoidales bacterium]|nr:hypothetical protein [Dehalococcoidales bacterium]
MKQQNKQPTLLGHICYPFFTHIIKKSIWGAYILGINLIKVEALVYLIGAVLGRSLRNKLPMLVKLLFVPGTEESQIDRVTALCRKDAGKNFKEFKEWCDDKPLRFDDFLFYRRIESLLGNANIHMSPRNAYVDYLNGDKKLKKIFEQKVDAKRDPEKSVGEPLLILLLQGIFFGSSFPEVTQTMYQKAWENDRRFWTRLWPDDLVMPEDLKEANLDEAEILIDLIVADYVSEYYPELIDGLGLMSVIQRTEPTGHDFH